MKQTSSEYKINEEGAKQHQLGHRPQKDQLEKDDEGQLKSVRDDKAMVYREHLVREQVGTKRQMLETEEECKQQNQFKKNEMEGEWSENKNPPLVRATPPEDEVVSAHGPGALVTELEDEEHLETIHLLPSRSLRTDDLPDLEDVDTEDLTEMFLQQAFKPKLEIISGGHDEEELNVNQSRGISTSRPDGKASFLMKVCKESDGVSDKSSSLVYPEDEDTLPHQPKCKTNQSSSSQRCLIEELD